MAAPTSQARYVSAFFAVSAAFSTASAALETAFCTWGCFGRTVAATAPPTMPRPRARAKPLIVIETPPSAPIFPIFREKKLSFFRSFWYNIFEYGKGPMWASAPTEQQIRTPNRR